MLGSVNFDTYAGERGKTGALALVPVLGPGGEVVVHGFCQFLQRALEWKWLPSFATMERQAVPACAEWRKSKAWIRTVLVGASDNQMTAARDDVQPAGDIASFEQSL